MTNPNISDPSNFPKEVMLWINFSACCIALLAALRAQGWNPVVRSYGNPVPIAEVDGISFYGMDRISANLLTN